jgi:hypothetical protein
VGDGGGGDEQGGWEGGGQGSYRQDCCSLMHSVVSPFDLRDGK